MIANCISIVTRTYRCVSSEDQISVKTITIAVKYNKPPLPAGYLVEVIKTTYFHGDHSSDISHLYRTARDREL